MISFIIRFLVLRLLRLFAAIPSCLDLVAAVPRCDLWRRRSLAMCQKLERIPEFFPEFAGKTICPTIATVYIEPSLNGFLDRERIYGIAMGDDVMEVVNLGHF